MGTLLQYWGDECCRALRSTGTQGQGLRGSGLLWAGLGSSMPGTTHWAQGPREGPQLDTPVSAGPGTCLVAEQGMGSEQGRGRPPEGQP